MCGQLSLRTFQTRNRINNKKSDVKATKEGAGYAELDYDDRISR